MNSIFIDLIKKFELIKSFENLIEMMGHMKMQLSNYLPQLT